MLMEEYLGWKISSEYAIDGLGLTIVTGDNSYVFTGKPPPPGRSPSSPV